MYKEASSTSYKPHSFPLDRVDPSTSSPDWQLTCPWAKHLHPTLPPHRHPLLFVREQFISGSSWWGGWELDYWAPGGIMWQPGQHPHTCLGPQPFDLSFFIIHHHLRVPLYFSYVSTMHISFDIEEEDKSPPHVLHAVEMEGRTWTFYECLEAATRKSEIIKVGQSFWVELWESPFLHVPGWQVGTCLDPE